MKKNFFSIFSLWRKYKILLYLNLTVILVLSMTLNLSAAGFGEDKTSSIDNLQQVKISGTVTDGTTGEALPGVNVVIPGTTVGTMTDISGKYSLDVPNASARLQFSFIGYLTQDITLSGQTTLNVALLSDVAQLSEVIVVGYGTQLKKDLTGAVAAVSAKRLLDKPAFNVGTAMQGKIAGVQITDMGGGSPGIAPQVRIRGTNSLNTSNDPLYVVDGIVGVANALLNLNPNDIESINVLKDASSTAIYGARGANGVIMITTKRGVSGKAQVEYAHYTAYNTMQRHFYTLNADQLMYVYEQSMANGDKYAVKGIDRAKDFRGAYATGQSYSEMPWLFKEVPAKSYLMDLIGKNGKSYAPIYNSNWEAEAYGPSFSNSDQLSVRGGGENAKFGLSFGKSDENGLMKNSFYKRYSAKMNGDVKIFKWLDVNSELTYRKTEKTNKDTDNITRNSAEAWSILPIKYPDDPALGIYASRWARNSDFNVGEQWYPPNFLMDQRHGFDYNDQITGSVIANVKITKDLTFKSNFAVDVTNPKSVSYDGKMYGGDGSAGISTNKNFYWQNENYFNYAKTLGEVHNITAMVGLSWSRSNTSYFAGSNSIFFDNFYQWHNIGVGAQTRPVPASSDGVSSLNSYFARLNYSFKEKYLLTLTGRYDGSSKFGTNSKYGFFPSVGLGWRISDEEFIKNIEAISNLKLRASWGQTGNQEIGSYVTQTYLSSTNVILGGTAYTGLYPSSVGNDDLRWETSTQWDLGLELGLFKNRINIDVDYYKKLTSDMLLTVLLPRSTTVGSVRQNFGSIENKGLEFTLNTVNVSTADFSWNTSFLITSNRNTITNLGPTHADVLRNQGAGNGTSIWREGASVGSFFGLVRLGTYSTEEASLAARYNMLPGDLKYQDTNKDGAINLISDGVIIGSAFPKFTFNFNNSWTYKNFDASIDLRAVTGVDKASVNESAEDRQLVSGGKNTILEAWRPDAQNSQVAQVRPGNGGAYYQSYPDTHMIEDASFIRGEGATIGYTIPGSVLSKLGIAKARVYLAAKNFFVTTTVRGYDPEGSSADKVDSLTPNVDKYTYPRPSVYSFGFNIGF